MSSDLTTPTKQCTRFSVQAPGKLSFREDPSATEICPGQSGVGERFACERPQLSAVSLTQSSGPASSAYRALVQFQLSAPLDSKLLQELNTKQRSLNKLAGEHQVSFGLHDCGSLSTEDGAVLKIGHVSLPVPVVAELNPTPWFALSDAELARINLELANEKLPKHKRLKLEGQRKKHLEWSWSDQLSSRGPSAWIFYRCCGWAQGSKYESTRVLSVHPVANCKPAMLKEGTTSVLLEMLGITREGVDRCADAVIDALSEFGAAVTFKRGDELDPFFPDIVPVQVVPSSNRGAMNKDRSTEAPIKGSLTLCPTHRTRCGPTHSHAEYEEGIETIPSKNERDRSS